MIIYTSSSFVQYDLYNRSLTAKECWEDPRSRYQEVTNVQLHKASLLISEFSITVKQRFLLGNSGSWIVSSGYQLKTPAVGHQSLHCQLQKISPSLLFYIMINTYLEHMVCLWRIDCMSDCLTRSRKCSKSNFLK